MQKLKNFENILVKTPALPSSVQNNAYENIKTKYKNKIKWLFQSNGKGRVTEKQQQKNKIK